MTMVVPLGKSGREALIDISDAPLVEGYRWQAGCTTSSGIWYAYFSQGANRGYRHLGMHTLLTGWKMVDHINHDGLDNRRRNLRPTTLQQNAFNQRPQVGRSSRYRGVQLTKGRWRAVIKRDGVRKHLGYFGDELEAAAAYDEAAQELFGEYAYQNLAREPA